jgi:hypothetical protein
LPLGFVFRKVGRGLLIVENDNVLQVFRICHKPLRFSRICFRR